MKKTYFASDFHLGTPDYNSSLVREKKIVEWLDEIKADAENVFLVGDIFDFWYEYKKAIPKNFTRLLGKLAELTDLGVNVYFFKGNHDMWTFGYLEQEIGVKLIEEEWKGNIHGKSFFVHHGDALGPGDFLYKFIRAVFRSSWAKWLFHRLHPNFGIGLAQFLSKRSRKKNTVKDKVEIPLDKEFQFQFIQSEIKTKEYDFFIFGHRHLPRDTRINDKSRFINLGDWIGHYTYAVFDGNELKLETYNH